MKWIPDIRENEVTPRDLFLRRREFIAGVGAAALAGTAGAQSALPGAKSKLSTAGERLTPRKDVLSYNNFYELGVPKEAPARNAARLKTRPWTVVVDGLCARPGRFAIEDLLKKPLEERIYRLRCVEAWSMVIPWTGFQLSELLRQVEPTGEAKFVAFETLLRPAELIGQRDRVLDWPYREGLRLDEAMHPLTILALGVYGETLPGQSGAPIRLVVPWKYGFKSIKSIVRISLTATAPPSTWNVASPREYGFFSNVNPNVERTRWSQATERRIGEFRRRPTLLFNGYGEQVASLYRGMDLSTWF